MTGRADASANPWPEPERAIRGDGPEPLGLGARDASLVLVADPGARIGSGATNLLAKRAKELLDVDGACSGGNPCRTAVFGVVRGHRGILAGAEVGGLDQ